MEKAIGQLVQYFNQFLPLGQDEIDALSNRVQIRKIKRRQFVLQEMDVCRHYNFIVSGCLKLYGVDYDGKEHNLQFAIENDWITDIGSFHSEKPSRLYIEAMEPALILQLSKPALLELYTAFPKFDRNFRVLIEDKFVELQDRLLQNISLTAEQRYQQFLNNYPEIANRIPNTQIASYLGITPEFLSKLRKEIQHKNRTS